VGASGNAEINGVTGGSCGSSATFSGSFRRDGTGSGTWSDLPSRGTWSCRAGGSGSNGIGSCSGGGGSGNSNLSFPIQAARINEITTPLTTVGSYSGTVEGYAASGSVTVSTSALSTAVFEGVNRSAKSTTESGTISYNGNSIPTNSTSIDYYDASANFYGYTSPYSYGLVISRTPIPVSVRVGDSGNLHILNRYTDSTKLTLSAVVTTTYSVEADTANTALVKISIVEKNTLGVVTSQDVLTYRITSSGIFNPVNRTVYTPTGVNVTITFN